MTRLLSQPQLLPEIDRILLAAFEMNSAPRCLPAVPPQTFVFAAPLPLRDRELRVEVYRTASNTQRGRLISIANVRRDVCLHVALLESTVLACPGGPMACSPLQPGR